LLLREEVEAIKEAPRSKRTMNGSPPRSADGSTPDKREKLIEALELDFKTFASHVRRDMSDAEESKTGNRTNDTISVDNHDELIAMMIDSPEEKSRISDDSIFGVEKDRKRLDESLSAATANKQLAVKRNISRKFEEVRSQAGIICAYCECNAYLHQEDKSRWYEGDRVFCGKSHAETALLTAKDERELNFLLSLLELAMSEDAVPFLFEAVSGCILPGWMTSETVVTMQQRLALFDEEARRAHELKRSQIRADGGIHMYVTRKMITALDTRSFPPVDDDYSEWSGTSDRERRAIKKKESSKSELKRAFSPSSHHRTEMLRGAELSSTPSPPREVESIHTARSSVEPVPELRFLKEPAPAGEASTVIIARQLSEMASSLTQMMNVIQDQQMQLDRLQNSQSLPPARVVRSAEKSSKLGGDHAGNGRSSVETLDLLSELPAVNSEDIRAGLKSASAFPTSASTVRSSTSSKSTTVFKNDLFTLLEVVKKKGGSKEHYFDYNGKIETSDNVDYDSLTDSDNRKLVKDAVLHLKGLFKEDLINKPQHFQDLSREALNFTAKHLGLHGARRLAVATQSIMACLPAGGADAWQLAVNRAARMARVNGYEMEELPFTSAGFWSLIYNIHFTPGGTDYNSKLQEMHFLELVLAGQNEFGAAITKIMKIAPAAELQAHELIKVIMRAIMYTTAPKYRDILKQKLMTEAENRNLFFDKDRSSEMVHRVEDEVVELLLAFIANFKSMGQKWPLPTFEDLQADAEFAPEWARIKELPDYAPLIHRYKLAKKAGKGKLPGILPLAPALGLPAPVMTKECANCKANNRSSAVVSSHATAGCKFDEMRAKRTAKRAERAAAGGHKKIPGAKPKFHTGIICYSCQQEGHYAGDCPSKQASKTSGVQPVAPMMNFQQPGYQSYYPPVGYPPAAYQNSSSPAPMAPVTMTSPHWAVPPQYAGMMHYGAAAPMAAAPPMMSVPAPGYPGFGAEAPSSRGVHFSLNAQEAMHGASHTIGRDDESKDTSSARDLNGGGSARG